MLHQTKIQQDEVKPLFLNDKTEIFEKEKEKEETNIGTRLFNEKLHNYINCLDAYRLEMYNHLSVIFVMMLLFSVLGLSRTNDFMFYWISTILTIIFVIFVSLSFIYVYKVIGVWDSTMKMGILKLRNVATQL